MKFIISGLLVLSLIYSNYVFGQMAHTSDVLAYKTWDGSNWTAKFDGYTFIHAPNGDFNRAHRDAIINYKTWDGGNWTAKLDGNTFIHAPNGDFNRGHRDAIINYKTWDGGNWTASIKGNKFNHVPPNPFPIFAERPGELAINDGKCKMHSWVKLYENGAIEAHCHLSNRHVLKGVHGQFKYVFRDNTGAPIAIIKTPPYGLDATFGGSREERTIRFNESMHPILGVATKSIDIFYIETNGSALSEKRWVQDLEFLINKYKELKETNRR